MTVTRLGRNPRRIRHESKSPAEAKEQVRKVSGPFIITIVIAVVLLGPNRSTEKSHFNSITSQRNKPQRRSPVESKVFVVVVCT